MSEADNIPEDWAIEAALKAPNEVENTYSSIWTVSEIKEAYKRLRYAASVMSHASLIAKYEQPPVDPDVEAVKRIITAWYGYDRKVFNPEKDFSLDRECLARAVAQYKQERAK